MYWRGWQGHLKARQMSGLYSFKTGARCLRSLWQILKRTCQYDPFRQGNLLRHLNDSSFFERRKSADSAKQQLLAKFASAPKPTDPEMRERLAAREAIASARTARRVERDAVKAGENDRLIQEAAAMAKAAEAHQRAESDARQAEADKWTVRAVADEAARKAERDRRYAARKARQA
jgi:hypothetical protein